MLGYLPVPLSLLPNLILHPASAPVPDAKLIDVGGRIRIPNRGPTNNDDLVLVLDEIVLITPDDVEFPLEIVVRQIEPFAIFENLQCWDFPKDPLEPTDQRRDIPVMGFVSQNNGSPIPTDMKLHCEAGAFGIRWLLCNSLLAFPGLRNRRGYALQELNQNLPTLLVVLRIPGRKIRF